MGQAGRMFLLEGIIHRVNNFVLIDRGRMFVEILSYESSANKSFYPSCVFI